MELTKTLAKELSLEVWRCLRDHPEIKGKCELPIEIFEKIKDFEAYCPLCEYFHSQRIINRGRCPLVSCDDLSDYDNWCNSLTNESRALYAAKIVEKIEAMVIEDEM